MLERWKIKDSPNQHKMGRNRRIEPLQGRRNRFIDNLKLADGTHASAGKKETVDREMAAPTDCDRGNFGVSRCDVGCQGAWRIKVLP